MAAFSVHPERHSAKPILPALIITRRLPALLLRAKRQLFQHSLMLLAGSRKSRLLNLTHSSVPIHPLAAVQQEGR